ncbi:MAG: hypothetical protein ACPG61_16555, partial [Paracoccaceae bacterium]
WIEKITPQQIERVSSGSTTGGVALANKQQIVTAPAVQHVGCAVINDQRAGVFGEFYRFTGTLCGAHGFKFVNR